MNKEHLTTLGVVISVLFFGLKLWAGFVSNSIAVISDAVNSFLDVFSYTIIKISVKLQNKRPDKTHPFGYYRAEPLAGLIISLVAFMLGGNIVKDSIVSFTQNEAQTVSSIPLIVMGASVLTKVVLALLFLKESKRANSPALLAAFIDSRNDILASLTAFIGFLLSSFWDSLAALLIGLWILYSAFGLAMSNLGYLIGVAPEEGFLEKMRALALDTPSVSGINDIRAHFVGTYLHVEIHIEVEPELPVKIAHDIGEEVRQKLLKLQDVDTVFVHIDVVGDTERLF